MFAPTIRSALVVTAAAGIVLGLAGCTPSSGDKYELVDGSAISISSVKVDGLKADAGLKTFAIKVTNESGKDLSMDEVGISGSSVTSPAKSDSECTADRVSAQRFSDPDSATDSPTDNTWKAGTSFVLCNGISGDSVDLTFIPVTGDYTEIDVSKYISTK